MDRNYIDRHLVIDRYLAGTLSESEIAEFEERLVWDEELVDEVDLAEKLQNGLQSSVIENSSTGPGPQYVESRNWWSRPQLAAAASFVLGIAVSTTFLNSPQFANNVDYGQPSLARLEVMRNSDIQAFPYEETGIRVLVFYADSSFPSYRVSLRESGASAVIWSQDDLRPDRNGDLAAGILSATLKPGRYSLTIEGIDDSGLQPAGSFSFEIRE